MIQYSYFRLTWASPGFMGKSQMIEFIREIHKMFSPSDDERRGSLSVPSFLESNSDHPPPPYRRPSIILGQLVSFDMFHRVAVGTQYSLSRNHSLILWILMSTQLSTMDEEIHQFLPVADVCRLLPDIFLQSVDSHGEIKTLFNLNTPAPHTGFPLSHTECFGSVASYKGIHQLWLKIFSSAPVLRVFKSKFIPKIDEKNWYRYF